MYGQPLRRAISTIFALNCHRRLTCDRIVWRNKHTVSALAHRYHRRCHRPNLRRGDTYDMIAMFTAAWATSRQARNASTLLEPVDVHS